MRLNYGLIVVLLAATVARVAWVYVGLPQVTEVDSYKFVYYAREMFLSGSLQPLHFQNPALYTYLLVLVNHTFDIHSDYMFYLSARLVSCVFGIGLVWLVWLVARNAMGRWAALLASALVASDVLLVTISRTEKTDMLLVFVMTLGLWAVARQRIQKVHVGVAAIALGLSIATKWTGLYLVLFFGAAALVNMVRTREVKASLLVLSAVYAGGLITFILVNPYFPANYDLYYDRFLLEANIQRFGNVGSVQAGWSDYFWSDQRVASAPWLGLSIAQNQGVFLLSAALIGSAFTIYKRSWPLVLHVVFVLCYFLLIVRPGHLITPRFVAPVLPSIFILAASCVEYFAEKFKVRDRGVFLVFSLLFVFVPLMNVSSYVMNARGEMTQIQAARWIAGHLPQDAVINVSHFFLDNFRFLPQTFHKIPNVPSRMNRFPDQPELNGELTPIYHAGLVDEFRAEGIEYVITNSWLDDSFMPTKGNKKWFPVSVENSAAWRSSLESQSELIWSINAEDAGVLGPNIFVYRLRTEN